MKELVMKTVSLIGAAALGACSGAPAEREELSATESSALTVAGDDQPDVQADVVGGPVTQVTCGRTPKAPVCNRPVCGPEGFWVFWPLPINFGCTYNGQAGHCDGGDPGPPGQTEPNELGMCVINAGQLNPEFYVLGVIYAPPGFQGNASQASTVSYANGSSFSHDTRVTNSFKAGTSITARANFPTIWEGQPPLSTTFGFGYSVTNSTTTGLTITKAQTNTITYPGAAVDGINHDEDEIYLWLNPRMISQQASNGTFIWSLANNPDGHAGNTMEVQFVKIGHLKGTIPMEPGLLAELNLHGITPAHYPKLLAYDPFANGDVPVDTGRFALTSTAVPYELNAPATSLTLGNVQVVSTGQTRIVETTISVTAQAGNQTTWGQLNVTGSMTWTDTNSSSDSWTTSESATATVRGHSAAYTGPSNIAVYFDTIYKTFMFRYITVPASISGAVLSSDGKPMVHQAVDLVVNGVEYHTITDTRGEYRFFDTPKGAATLKVNKTARPVLIGAEQARADVAL